MRLKKYPATQSRGGIFCDKEMKNNIVIKNYYFLLAFPVNIC